MRTGGDGCPAAEGAATGVCVCEGELCVREVYSNYIVAVKRVCTVYTDN